MKEDSKQWSGWYTGLLTTDLYECFALVRVQLERSGVVTRYVTDILPATTRRCPGFVRHWNNIDQTWSSSGWRTPRRWERSWPSCGPGWRLVWRYWHWTDRSSQPGLDWIIYYSLEVSIGRITRWAQNNEGKNILDCSASTSGGLTLSHTWGRPVVLLMVEIQREYFLLNFQ